MTQTITRSVDRYSDHDNPAHLWSITIDGQRISELWVSMGTGEIAMVWTHPEHRGRGYATALYRQACSEMPVYHAPVTHREDDGQAFADAVGGPSMPDCTTCCAHLYDYQPVYLTDREET